MLVAEHGGVGLLLNAMRRFEGSVHMQESGCGAIGAIAATVPENKAAIIVAGGLHVVCAAMAAFPDNREFQEYAVSAIQGVVWNLPPLIDAALEAGVEPLLRHAADLGLENAVQQLQRMGI